MDSPGRDFFVHGMNSPRENAAAALHARMRHRGQALQLRSHASSEEQAHGKGAGSKRSRGQRTKTPRGEARSALAGAQPPRRTVKAKAKAKSKAKSKAGGGRGRHWSPAEDAQLRAAVAEFGDNWIAIAEHVDGRRRAQCEQRWTKVLNPNIKKGPWGADEDRALLALVMAADARIEAGGGARGRRDWKTIAKALACGRTEKQCRERYSNHLDPTIKKTKWTEAEARATP